MRCPRCNQEGQSARTACTKCGFSGPPSQVEELSHVAYLLGELEGWRWLGAEPLQRLRDRYLRRREELEMALGLRKPPLSTEEARELQWEVFRLGELQEEVAYWREQGWVGSEPAKRLGHGAKKRIESLRQRLTDGGAPPAPAFDGVQDRLKLFDYLEEMANRAKQRGHFVDDEAHAAALADLRADRHDLEVEAGLRPRPVEPIPTPAAVAPEPAAKAVVAPSPPAPPPKPREPITWDRVWQTLLSERTLNVLLFLGAFLLVASAITYVVYNWERLPPAAQLGAIVLFTLSFYGAGWLLRVRMNLRASGIAVTAVGSLLVPVDFYAVFVAGGVLPAGAWPWVWLMASVVCLPIYTLTALRIRAEFFGYLVTVAAGSLLCATLQVMGVPEEWFLCALVALALALAWLAYRLRPERVDTVASQVATPGNPTSSSETGEAPGDVLPQGAMAGGGTWSLLCTPFCFSSLVATAAILLAGMGWWVVNGLGGFHLGASLAGAWTLGAVLYAYAADRERSPLLGRGAATVLPVALVLLLRLVYEPLGIEWPWYALGWAVLAPLYVWIGHRYHARAAGTVPSQIPSPSKDETEEESDGAQGGDPVLCAHGQTATGWGLGLIAAAAVWAVFDLWAAAATHGVLVAGVALAVRLWQRPRALPLASLLALSSMTFAMAAGHLEPAELCLGWALLALLHVLVALRLRSALDYAARLFAAALAVAALAFLPPLVLAHEPLFTYILGHWIALAGWLVWLDHTSEHPGLTAFLKRFGPLRQSVLHWAVALPLPFLTTMVYTRFRAPDAWLGLVLGVLAWICFAAGQLRHLTSPGRALLVGHWSFPWYVVGYGCSLASPLLALYSYDPPLLAGAVLLASALYFFSAWAFRGKWWFVPAGTALPLGLLILLDFWAVPWPRQSLILALVPVAYLLGGIGLERRRRESAAFLEPLYGVAHLMALFALFWGLEPALEHLSTGVSWPGSARLWTAGGQLLLGIAYCLFAWFRNQEGWAQGAAWLGVMAAGLAATAYSQGRGSSAFKAALLAAVYVLVERILASSTLRRRWRLAGRAWSLYRRPLLIAGWAVSAGAVGLAAFRNLLWLGGGQVREAWAIAGLLLVTALYALSARMFRRRIFLWLAGVLIIAPWTMLTLWGWFLWDAPPALPRYALAWTLLACMELGIGLLLTFRSAGERDYGFPLRAIANVVLPVALFWAVADPATSSITWGLGLAFYASSAVVDHRQGLAGWRAARFLYPAVAVLLMWAIYLLNRFAPTALYETYGLLLLIFALPLLAVGRRLRRVDPADGMPLYLGAYGAAIVGTVLVAHVEPLLGLALTFDALLCALSARVFREPSWGYPAAALAPAAMLVALAQSEISPERRGWWLIGLGAVYLVLAWLLRRVKLRKYAIPPLAMAFVVVVLGLPPSSLDDVGAFWGYLAAALVYAAAAAWLRQPLLLTPSVALLAVPYGVAVHWLNVNPADYGLVMFPGVAIALAVAHLLDWWLGRAPSFLTSWKPKTWRLEALLDWWAAPFYAWGYIGALAAVGFSGTDATRLAITLVLAAATFMHATWRFRSRGYLLLAGALAQGAALTTIDAWGWLEHPSWAALAFLPVTVITAALALTIELQRREGSPLGSAWFSGWSRPLYLLLLVDLLGGQMAALIHSEPGAVVTIGHALLLALLATVWVQPLLPFAALGLGIAGFFQAMHWAGVGFTGYPLGLALLALGYGLLGYGARYAGLVAGRAIQPYASANEVRASIWARPLEWLAWGISAAALLWALVAGLDVVGLVFRTLLGRAVAFADYAPQVRMVMWVLAITGLFYLASAVVRRWTVLGYGAVALLMGAWALWWRFFMVMPSFQWYAVPAGLYLLGVGWMEWRQGRKSFACWVDRVGIVVWLGTAWWQSMPGVMEDGWPYALVMLAEALLLVWWGSARRQKQFLYIGVVGVVLNAITQSIEPLLSANRWIVFGIVGALLVGVAVLVERNLKAIRELSVEMRERLEGWE